LKQSFFLLGQTIFVGLARITAQEAVWITAIHGMMLDQTMWLSNVGLIVSTMRSGNLDLSGNGHVIFVTATRIDEFGFFVAHTVIYDQHVF
jgi:hypothetical protein